MKILKWVGIVFGVLIVIGALTKKEETEVVEVTEATSPAAVADQQLAEQRKAEMEAARDAEVRAWVDTKRIRMCSN